MKASVSLPPGAAPGFQRLEATDNGPESEPVGYQIPAAAMGPDQFEYKVNARHTVLLVIFSGVSDACKYLGKFRSSVRLLFSVPPGMVGFLVPSLTDVRIGAVPGTHGKGADGHLAAGGRARGPWPPPSCRCSHACGLPIGSPRLACAPSPSALPSPSPLLSLPPPAAVSDTT